MQSIAAAAENTALSPTDTPVALQIVGQIAENWGLSVDQQITLLGSPGRSTFFKWRKEGGQLPADTQERVSHILGIHKALEILIPDANIADSWAKQPNRAFNGESPLDHALRGRLSDLYEVRRYLDAQRGG